MLMEAEKVRPPEGAEVLGEYETVALRVDDYVRLPQVRSEMNPELPNLKDSIRSRGLINQIDVARMTPDQLETYIEFVNNTWRTAVAVDEYSHQQQSDGYYYVVVAGHSRAEAISQIQDEDVFGRVYTVAAKVHQISDPEELISLQLDENLHSKPSQEQRAIAVVETYLYGLNSGLWSNKAQFLERSQGKFSRRILNEAIGFANLPPEARDFVFSGQLSYSTAVAVGQATDVILEHTATRLGYDRHDQSAQGESADEYEQAYRHQVALMLAGVTNRNLNGTAAKKYIAGRVQQMQLDIDRLRGEEPDDALFGFDLISAESQRAEYLKGLERQHREALREMARLSVDKVDTVIDLHQRLIGVGGVEDLRQERKRRLAQPLLARTLAVANS